MEGKRLEEKLQKLKLLEAKKVLHDGLPHLYGLPHYKWSREFYESREKMNLLCAANQIGKALDIDEEIPTPDGFKRLGDLRIGDYVIGMDGLPTQVINIPFEGICECYLVCFDNGHKVIASEDHEWVIRRNRSFTDQEAILTTGEMRDYGKYEIKASQGYRDKIHINYPAPIQFTNKQKLFDPYLVGWLLTSNKSRGIPSLPLKKIHRYHSKILEYKTFAKISDDRIYFPEIADKLFKQGININYRQAIPMAYLRGTITERKELLAGILDSISNIELGYVAVYLWRKKFTESIVQLLQSLGGKAVVVSRKDDCYSLLIKTAFMTFTSPDL